MEIITQLSGAITFQALTLQTRGEIQSPVENSSSPGAPQTHAAVQLPANLSITIPPADTESTGQSLWLSMPEPSEIALQPHQSLELPSLEENMSGGPDLPPSQSKN